MISVMLINAIQVMEDHLSHNNLPIRVADSAQVSSDTARTFTRQQLDVCYPYLYVPYISEKSLISISHAKSSLKMKAADRILAKNVA